MLSFRRAFAKSMVSSDIFTVGSSGARLSTQALFVEVILADKRAGFGIVEFEDGVRRVGPSSIKFCDEENAILCEMAKHHEALRRGEANAES